MKTNKWLCSCMIVALCLFSICTTAFANNNNVKVASKLDAKDVKINCNNCNNSRC